MLWKQLIGKEYNYYPILLNWLRNNHPKQWNVYINQTYNIGYCILETNNEKLISEFGYQLHQLK